MREGKGGCEVKELGSRRISEGILSRGGCT